MKTLSASMLGRSFQLHSISEDNHAVGTIVVMNFKDKEFHFQVKSKEVHEDKLKFVLSETGFWVKKLGHVHKDLDPRELVNIELSLVSDPELIATIKKESRYC